MCCSPASQSLSLALAEAELEGALVLPPDATYLFQEPVKLERELADRWFVRRFTEDPTHGS